jgi:site-specific DNA-cytosine methylase
MSFNPDKCEVLRITNKRNKIMTNYYIHGQQLQIVDKYLGLTISENLSWNNHVNNITKKANSTLAFLRRNIRNCPQRAKTQAYNKFVRPSLEYASTVWDPHTQTNINKVESIQRRAARFVTNNYDPRASVTTLLQDLNWPTLQHTPTSQTHHDVPHYLPSHRNIIYYLSHFIHIRYPRTQHLIPTTFNQSASISILLLP